jgi:hypothetical protein
MTRRESCAAAERTQPCSVTNFRVVVAQTLVFAKRASALMAVATRSLISGSRL